MLSPELQAGLLLLHSEDRRWLLSQLPAVERQRLQSLLSKLRELPPGFADKNGEARRSSTEADPPPTVAALGGDADTRLLDSAKPGEVQRLLDQLSANTVAVILKYREWSWGADVLTGFDMGRRGAVVSAVKQVEAVPPKAHFSGWLVQQLAEALRQSRASAADPARRFETLIDGAG